MIACQAHGFMTDLDPQQTSAKCPGPPFAALGSGRLNSDKLTFTGEVGGTR